MKSSEVIYFSIVSEEESYPGGKNGNFRSHLTAAWGDDQYRHP
ncbi:MAG: hypothetical protein ACXWLX_10395 [Rhizomicrobium sp.]